MSELNFTITDNPFHEIHRLLAKQQVWYHDIERLQLTLQRFIKGGAPKQIRETAIELKKAEMNLAELRLQIEDTMKQISGGIHETITAAYNKAGEMFKEQAA